MRRRGDSSSMSFAMLDVFCGALGVFVLMSIILLPHYSKKPTIPEEYAACVVNRGALRMRFYDVRREDGDVVRIELNGRVQAEELLLTNDGHTLEMALLQGVNDLEITSVADGDEPPNTGFVVIEPCQGDDKAMIGWMIKEAQTKKFAIIRK